MHAAFASAWQGQWCVPSHSIQQGCGCIERIDTASCLGVGRGLGSSVATCTTLAQNGAFVFSSGDMAPYRLVAAVICDVEVLYHTKLVCTY
jgi:hypothetical protein